MARKCKKLFNKFDFIKKKEHEKSLNQLLVDYNIMLLENSELKRKIQELTETIYQLADLE